MILHIFIILLLLSQTQQETRKDLKPSLDPVLAVRFTDIIANERYEDALNIADSVLLIDPHRPEGWFLRASVFNARSIDFEDDVDLEDLSEACDSVKSISEKMILDGDDSAQLKFFLGSILGYQSFMAFRTGELLKAISTGRKMAERYKEAIEQDSSCWDAYLGLGLYYYHWSKHAGILRSIGLVKDRRDEGIQMIKTCAEKGSISALAARSNLAWMAIEREDYDEAIDISGELLIEYPDRRAFLWCLGKAEMEAEKWADATRTYQKLLCSVRNETRNNRYNEIGCLHALTKANAELGNWREVIRLSGEALKIELSIEVAKRKAKDLERLKALHKCGIKKTSESIDKKPDKY